jgi:hypothetical protein
MEWRLDAAGDRLAPGSDDGGSGPAMNMRFIRCSDTLTAEVGGEIVALNVDRGQCYGLNEVASRIWELLAEPKSLGEICAALAEDYDVEPEACATDVGKLIADLQAEGLVRRA